MRFHALIIFLSTCLGFSAVHAQHSLSEANARRQALLTTYVERLYPQEDPFLRVFSLDQGVALFERLCARKQADGSYTKSPLAQVNDALKSWHARNQEMDLGLVQAVLDDADKVISSSGYSKIEQQSNLLALRMLGDYLNRFEVPVEVLNRDGETIVKKAKEKVEAKQKSKPRPAYQEMPKDYKPHTKDTKKDKEAGSKEDQYIIAEANFQVPFWGQAYYAEVVRGAAVPLQDIDLPVTFKAPSSSSATEKEMLVRTYGQTKVRLFLPPGFQPMQPLDPRARVSRSGNGGYELKLNQDLPEVRIPLQASAKEFLNPLAIEILTRKVGFDDSGWPDLIREDLFDKVLPGQKHNALTVAQAVANHLSGKYLYSVGERPENDPIDALKAGAFQCDMAAFLMVGVLRDVYEIPARVVGGFRAKKHKAGKDLKSYLVMPGDAHAWVEVYHEGQWYVYDPTPIKKDKKDEKDDGDGEKDEYSDRELENTLKPESEQEPEKDSESKEHGEQEEKKRSHQERVKEASQKREQEQKSEPEKKDAFDPAKIMDNQELASKLELGSVSLLEDGKVNPFRERAILVLLRLILDPRHNGKVILDGLTGAKSLILGSVSQETKSIFQEAMAIQEKNHDGLESWLRETANLLSTQKLSVSYKEIYRIQKSISLFGQTLQGTGTIQFPGDILTILDEVLRDIYQFAHTDSHEISIVQEFYHSLPGLVQQLLRQKYNLVSIGVNSATKEVARLLKAGEMNDYQLLSILSPLTDFILDATPRPEFEEVKTWQRDSKQPRGNDLMPLQRFSELPRSLLLNPGCSLGENLKKGHVFVPVRRQRVLIPTGHGIEEGERISIVLYDTSGSMSGDLARFQAGLIAAFTARAISDVSLSGRHRHKVVVVPFDDKPGTPVKITSTHEALNVVDDYPSKFASTGGGTDIQAALIQALALIADAQNRLGEPLAAANIVLMTDGQSPINFDELAKARNAIDRETPVQTMFVSLGQSNDELMKFARQSKSSGFDEGFYREYSHGHIQEILKEAKSNLFARVQPGFIYTEHGPSDLLLVTYQRIVKAQNLVREWLRSVESLDDFMPAKEHLQSIQTLKWNDASRIGSSLGERLQEMRRFSFSRIFQDSPSFLEAIIDDIFLNFKHLAGIDITQMTETELAHFRHWLEYSAQLSMSP